MSIASKYVDKFLAGMEKSGKNLYNKTIGIVRAMDTDRNGRLIRTPDNLSAIDDIAGAYSDFFSSATYSSRKTELIGSLDNIISGVTDIYEKRFGPLSSGDIQFMNDLAAQYEYALDGTLNDEQVEYAITNPVINNLYFQVGKEASLDSLESDYRDTEDALVNYFRVKVTVLTEQFERALMDGLAKRFAVKKWLYFGPSDARNRDFCAERVGGVYTADEIQQWANEDWEGKIPGTDMENIFVNAGGYNCRHVFLPEDDTEPTTSEANAPAPITPDIVEAKAKPFTPEFITDTVDNNHEFLKGNGYYSQNAYLSKEQQAGGASLGLSNAESSAVKSYTDGLYSDINAAARKEFTESGPNFTTEEMRRLDENLYRALEKSDLRSPTNILYRVEEETFEVYKEAYETGKAIENLGYTSTSYDEYSTFFKAGGFNTEFEKVRIKIIPADDMLASRARSISPVSNFPKEREVVFLRNTKFQVVSIDEKYMEVTLKEL